MCQEQRNIALLRSFDDLFDSDSIHIQSLRDRQSGALSQLLHYSTDR